MDGWTIATDIATILTGLSAATAAYVWLRTQWRGWQQEKAQTRNRNWHGFIMPEMISEWFVRLVEDPKTVTATVVLNVVGRDGQPDEAMAHSLRETIKADGQLARVPTPAEYDFLIAMRKERGYGKGFPVR
jgi:hypothetical protein